MKIYHDLLNHILTNGKERTDRTGVGTLSVFGYHMRHNLADGFPLLTTKKMHLKSVIHELLWMLKGDTNVKYLNDNGVTIWNEWASENGDLGPVYGKQFRSWPYLAQQFDDSYAIQDIDQIANLIHGLKTDPMSRRHIVSAWNVADLDDMALPPCHVLHQYYCEELTLEERRLHWGKVSRFKSSFIMKMMNECSPKTMNSLGFPKYKLSCQLYQRSCDVMLGWGFNFASYSLLTMMLAQVCNMVAGEFIHTIGDAHLYKNHLDQARLQLTRECRPLPKMTLNPIVKDIDDFKYEDFTLSEYDPHPHIKAEVAV